MLPLFIYGNDKTDTNIGTFARTTLQDPGEN